MKSNLTNKRAIVTGASKGIGLAIAMALCQEGVNTVICARKAEGVESAVGQIQQQIGAGKVFGTVADVSRYTDVVRLFQFADDKLGGLDILINNAGIGVFAPAADLNVEDWDRLIATNLSSAFYCSKESVPRLQKSGGGHIINISSLAGKNAFAGGAAYNASKFGMNGFSEALMLDHRADKIRVSYVMPGSVDTEFSGRRDEQKASWKIAAEDVAEIVIGILRMPARTLISRVEVRPSLPKKD